MVLCDFALGAPGSPVNKPISQIDAIDFRLLRVFDTVFDQRSLTRAALQLEISQPAVSQALGRLRRRFGDPLFVRSADGLAPTPRAEGLAAPVRAILAVYRDQLVASATFDASSAEREFAFYITDLGALLLMPTLMARFARVAPSRALSLAADEVHLRVERRTERPVREHRIDRTDTFDLDPYFKVEPRVPCG